MTKEQEMQLTREKALASQGKLVVNNPAFTAAFTAIRAEIFDDFCATDAKDGDSRDEAWRTMKNLDELHSYFVRILNTGKMAEEGLKLIKE